MQWVRLALTASLLSFPLGAQFGAPPAPDVLLVGRFHTPLSYDQVLAQLDAYYQEQVGRKLAEAFPRIAPGVHYAVWHDMWVFFAPQAASLTVTIKRPTDAATSTLAKGWMLQLAGRAAGGAPLDFQEEPALHQAEGEIYGSRRDVAAALAAESNIRLLPTWQHAGLLVSPAPLIQITLAPAGKHGVHQLTVRAETQAAARQLAARIAAGMNRPCVCAAYSETAELEEELRRDAIQKAEDINFSTAQRVYLAHPDPKMVEERLRADPETQKRIAAARGWADVRYRVDRPYPKVTIRWFELAGYSRESGRFEAEHPLGASIATNVRVPPQPGAQLTGRTRLEPLKPGAYRIVIDGDTASGQTVRIDQRDYWFDGKTFEEL